MRIYVASSWRNEQQPAVVAALRAAGHEVYDFRNPRPGDDGFRWRDVGLPQNTDHACMPADLRQALTHPRAVEGFASDSGAMKWAETCVLVLPSGRSAHLEAGWMAGSGRRTLVLAPDEPIEPELMYGLTEGLCLSIEEVIERLAGGARAPRRRGRRERASPDDGAAAPRLSLRRAPKARGQISRGMRAGGRPRRAARLCSDPAAEGNAVIAPKPICAATAKRAKRPCALPARPRSLYCAAHQRIAVVAIRVIVGRRP